MYSILSKFFLESNVPRSITPVLKSTVLSIIKYCTGLCQIYHGNIWMLFSPFPFFFFFLEEKVVLLLYFSDSKGSDKFYFCLHITKNDFQYFNTSSGTKATDKNHLSKWEYSTGVFLYLPLYKINSSFICKCINGGTMIQTNIKSFPKHRIYFPSKCLNLHKHMA